ncbi:MAG: D-2-hydroxyacid dehydrogenase [Anaerolineae bacterium]
MDPLNVVITVGRSEGQRLVDKVQAVSPNQNIIHRPKREAHDLSDVAAEVDILYTGDALLHPDDAPRLKWVQIHWAGVDHVLQHPLWTESNVLITNASGVHAINMGQYVMAMMLAFAHRIPVMIADTKAGTWRENRFAAYRPRELRGSTVGIVGYGAIGREVARLAKAFGMTVLAIKRDVRHLADHDSYRVAGTGDPEGELPDRYYPPEALHTFLKDCDFVVLLVPLTEATYHLIDQEALRAMPEHAVLINVARGDVVDEAALVEALREGWIAGAGLDVFSQEPLPEDSPLWGLENAILSPHVAGSTPYYNERASDLFVDNLRRYLKDEPLLNVVQRDLVY